MRSRCGGVTQKNSYGKCHQIFCHGSGLWLIGELHVATYLETVQAYLSALQFEFVCV